MRDSTTSTPAAISIGSAPSSDFRRDSTSDRFRLLRTPTSEPCSATIHRHRSCSSWAATGSSPAIDTNSSPAIVRRSFERSRAIVSSLAEADRALSPHLHLPGLSPGLVASAQGGWTEISSPGAAQSVRQLGVDLNGDPLSAATNGIRATAGGGVSSFSDLLHVGIARPIDHPAPWRFVVGFGTLFWSV